jgi:transposase
MQDLDAHIASLRTNSDLAGLLAPLFAFIDHQAAYITQLQAEIVYLKAQVVDLNAQVVDLRAQLNQRSTNSHKPPSSDGYAKKPAITREKPGNRGGQPGHRGGSLKMVAVPDEVDVVQPEQCMGCGHPLHDADVVQEERRQVFDLPQPRLHVKEYRRSVCRCPGCGSRVQAPFPEGVRAPTQYGAGVMALCALLHNEYHLPVGKIGQLFGDLYGAQLSSAINEGTILGATERVYLRLEESEEAIRTALHASPLMHVDETGLRCAGRLHWLHGASNQALTYYFVHEKRGGGAFKNSASLLPEFLGHLVHDCLPGYFLFGKCKHALCGAHLLRELIAVSEWIHSNETAHVAPGGDATWADAMIELLLEANKLVAERQVLDRSTYYQFKERYFALLRVGLETHAPYMHLKGQKGRRNRGKARSLIKRLIDHHQAVWAFARHRHVPFTNNQAERDIRMVKLKQKISGGFRTLAGAAMFARIRGFCSTARKQGLSVFGELQRAFREPGYVIALQAAPK